VIRILLADDQAMVRTGLRMIIDAQSDLTVVGEAADGRDAVEQARRLMPDVVLMDIRMPTLDGIAATRQLVDARETPEVRVIVLTTFDLDEHVVDALYAGASGFLLKDAPAEVLLDGIRAVERGDALLDPAVTRRMIDRFVTALPRPDTAVASTLATLTGREREVLTLIAGGLSNDEIADRLHLADSTVKTHVSSVLAKLHLRDRVQAVVLAYETGLVRPGSD
jgi:DNA-binding NarL/FixJ family response regulator